MRGKVSNGGAPDVVASGIPGSVFGTLSCAHETPRVSVIIPCRDREQVIGEQLEALARQCFDGPWEVIVADNGSTDGTREVAESFRDRLPALRVVDASARRGPGHARNAGARAAHGESLLFIDDDDEIQPGFLAAMAEALEVHDFVASARDMEKLNHSPVQRLRGNPQGGGLQRAWYAPHLPFGGGSGLAIKRALHERVGGFDETMRYGQDNDYCFKVQLATGTELHFAPDAVISVRCRTSLKATMRQAMRWSKGHVQLHMRYAPPTTERHATARAWWYTLLELARLAKRVPTARTREDWLRLGWDAAWLAGQIAGGITCLAPPVP